MRAQRLKPFPGQFAGHRALALGWGNLRGNAVHAFWSYINNFGDRLTPLLLGHFGHTAVPCLHAEAADIVVTGSLLHWVPESYAGAILGTGLIEDRAMSFPRARILAVRGRLTLARIGARAATPLGDPGLLAARLVPPPPAARVTLGLVPHYVDKPDPRLHRLVRRLAPELRVIDVQRHPRQVLADIAQCAGILSSSLHGLVVADAYGIPSAWIAQSNRVRGEGFKFRDHFSALGVDQAPVTLSGDESLSDLQRRLRPVPASVRERIGQLESLFLTLSEHLPERGPAPLPERPAASR